MIFRKKLDRKKQAKEDDDKEDEIKHQKLYLQKKNSAKGSPRKKYKTLEGEGQLCRQSFYQSEVWSCV